MVDRGRRNLGQIGRRYSLEHEQMLFGEVRRPVVARHTVSASKISPEMPALPAASECSHVMTVLDLTKKLVQHQRARQDSRVEMVG